MTFPHSPGFARNSDTSRQAAETLSNKDKMQRLIIEYMGIMPGGITPDEAKSYLERILDREFDRSTVAARFTELKELGRIIETAERRKTPRGKPAAVCVLKENYNTDMGKQARRRNNGANDDRYEANCELALMLARYSNATPTRDGFVKIEITPMELAQINKLKSKVGL